MKKILLVLSLCLSLFCVEIFAAGSYTCKSGDTLQKICNKYNITVKQLLQSNPQLKKSVIKPGQKLNIPPPADVQTYEKEVAKLVNAERSKRGLQTLTFSAAISKVARYKSQDMINKNYFSHISPTYGSPFKMMESFGIKFSAAGENIAYGQKTPADVMKAWMNSPGHRANILSKTYMNIGVGLARSKTGVSYWTQMFTKPLK